MPNAFTEVSVASTSYGSSPDLELDWLPNQWLFQNLEGAVTDVVYVSFDGVNDHGAVIPTIGGGTLMLPTKSKRIWLRLGGSATNPTPVNLTAFTADL